MAASGPGGLTRFETAYNNNIGGVEQSPLLSSTIGTVDAEPTNKKENVLKHRTIKNVFAGAFNNIANALSHVAHKVGKEGPERKDRQMIREVDERITRARIEYAEKNGFTYVEPPHTPFHQNDGSLAPHANRRIT